MSKTNLNVRNVNVIPITVIQRGGVENVRLEKKINKNNKL